MPRGSGLLAGRDFRLLLVGQTTGQLGAQVSGVAMPLVAVLTLQASAFQVGMLNAAGTVAFLVVGLPAGAWLDRVRRRPVLVASDLVRCVLLVRVPVAAALGMLTIAQLLVVALLSGFARVFFDVGYQSYLPTVVGKDRVLAGNSALETVRASGQFAGPGIGGWLVATLGAANVLLVQTASFLVSAVSLAAVRTPEERPAAGVPRERLWAQVGEGLRFVVASRPLRAVATASALSNLAFAAASAVNILFAVRTLGLSPTFAVLTPLASPGWGVALFVAGVAVGELGQIVYAVTQLSLRQVLVPNHLLARTNATMRFLAMGSLPAGALAGGALGETTGLRGTLWVACALLLLAPLPVFLALRHHRDVDDVPAP